VLPDLLPLFSGNYPQPLHRHPSRPSRPPPGRSVHRGIARPKLLLRDRDGKISSDDYDVCIADDGQKSGGGVGEAGLFSAGVRNSVGYCGYIHNEDTGLYTVRFRTYSAVLGRWLTRDPIGTEIASPDVLRQINQPVESMDAVVLGIGSPFPLMRYRDGAALYQYVRSGPVDRLDPSGLGVFEWILTGDGILLPRYLMPRSADGSKGTGRFHSRMRVSASWLTQGVGVRPSPRSSLLARQRHK